MKAFKCRILLQSAIVVAGLLSSNAFAAQYTLVTSITAPTNAAQMVYSKQYGTLILRNSASSIAVIDYTTRQIKNISATTRFTDLSISADGRYVYAADYGGENIGYGTPYSTSYVHRFDLASKTWGRKPTDDIAGNIAAVSGSTFILSSLDQWVTFTYNSVGTGTKVTPLNTSSGYWGNGYYAGVYSGKIQFDARNNRLLHGNDGSSSQEITAFKLANNNFTRQESSGTYGSASGYGGSLVLSTDGSALYYGQLQVDPLDVSHNRRVFPEVIRAANARYAFGNGKYYDAATGVLAGDLGYSTTVYALSIDGTQMVAFDSSANLLKFYKLTGN